MAFLCVTMMFSKENHSWSGTHQVAVKILGFFVHLTTMEWLFCLDRHCWSAERNVCFLRSAEPGWALVTLLSTLCVVQGSTITRALLVTDSASSKMTRNTHHTDHEGTWVRDRAKVEINCVLRYIKCTARVAMR